MSDQSFDKVRQQIKNLGLKHKGGGSYEIDGKYFGRVTKQGGQFILKKAGETVKSAAKGVQGFFDKVIQFGATILIGQLITALPGLIEKFKEWKERNKNLINIFSTN